MSQESVSQHGSPRSASNRRRWVARGVAVGVVAAPLFVLGLAQANAAEIAPIAEEVDSVVADTTQTVYDVAGEVLGTK